MHCIFPEEKKKRLGTPGGAMLENRSSGEETGLSASITHHACALSWAVRERIS